VRHCLPLIGFLFFAAAGCGGGSTQSGAIPSKNLTPQTLFVVNSGSITAGSVTVYAPPYTGAPTTIRAGLTPLSIAVDAAADLFVGTYSDAMVNVYAPPYTGPPTTISDGVHTVGALVLDPAGNLFVLNRYLTAGDFIHGSVTQYAPPYTGKATTTITPSGPATMIRDATGNLIVGRNTEIDVFAPPFGGPPMTSTKNGLLDPLSFALDSGANLFVANYRNGSDGTVMIYTPPYTGAPTMVRNAVSGPHSLVLDPTGNLFVANLGTNTVTEYAPPYSGAPIASINNGVNAPAALALDRMGNLFVANAGNDTVTVYTPPYSGTPTTISNGVKTPIALLLTP
jgi:hypothetical protein